MKQPLTLAEILAVLSDPQSVTDLKRYFGHAGESAFTGGQFERLGGGGDRPETCNLVTAEDLIAVELLSVRVPPRTALDLLQGALGEAVSAELGEIPTTVALGHPGALPLVEKGQGAYRAWRLLRKADGIGWVVAGKLLARKRPHLVPVYDEVVACAFRTRKDFWRWLHGRLGERDGILAERLADLRRQAELPDTISLLRILDVVMWMRHRDEHTGYRCPGGRLPTSGR
ncbi:hypothetical protein GA0070610_2906 [Micromonospora echinofusca]|uniref:Uncharacterized protein n=1 Tax=Micromonospora echinofusca TaxID=47858 RepID=A0A1C5G9R7_MICEH|nr:DUF6308 family protein [Micromonospora echinofusca]SCG16634.1 hypothetical protein GA0070610_2906 [Micromonospora echinofusca]